MPPYYATPDAAHPNKPTDPCNPNGEEDFVGTLIGLDNDGDNLFDLNDTDCQVVVPAPDINLSPFALNFGAVPAGSSATLNTEIQNLGTVNLNVRLINLCVGTSTEFTWAPVAPFTVAPSMSQTLAVTYAPVDDGIDTGCLAISSNDPDEATRQLGLNNTSSILRFIPAFIHPDKTGLNSADGSNTGSSKPVHSAQSNQPENNEMNMTKGRFLMKKSVMLAIVGMAAMVMSAGTSFGAVVCDGMQIVQSTGTTPYTASGLFVKVKPTVANSCGAAGAQVQYFLDVNNTDATYATILTALSLNKTLFIRVSAATANSLLLVTSVKQ